MTAVTIRRTALAGTTTEATERGRLGGESWQRSHRDKDEDQP